MDNTGFALVSAGIAIVSGFISASLSTWLQGRAQVSTELREARTKLYPVLWRHTELVSRWPWTDATFADLERLHLTLRDWYYDGHGGLYLSENSRERYGDVQELLAAHVRGAEAASAQLPDSVYDAIATTCSSLRSALTEDLESRRQSSLWTAARRALLHRRQKRQARRRIKAAEASAGARPRLRVPVESADRATPPAASG
jgi:hypothetical protein